MVHLLKTRFGFQNDGILQMTGELFPPSWTGRAHLLTVHSLQSDLVVTPKPQSLCLGASTSATSGLQCFPQDGVSSGSSSLLHAQVCLLWPADEMQDPTRMPTGYNIRQGIRWWGWVH